MGNSVREMVEPISIAIGEKYTTEKGYDEVKLHLRSQTRSYNLSNLSYTAKSLSGRNTYKSLSSLIERKTFILLHTRSK